MNSMITKLTKKFTGSSKIMDEILDYIDANPNMIKGNIQYQPEEVDSFFYDLIKENNLGTKITEARTHFMRKGAVYDYPHDHHLDTGVYYLQVPKNSGVLKIDKTKIAAKEGLFVIIPANTMHTISKNKSKEVRIAFVFCIE